MTGEVITFSAHPKALANVLHNALVMAKGKDSRQPLIYLRYNWDEETGGQLTAIGVSRFCAGLDWINVEAGTPGGYAEVGVLGVNRAKTEIVDDLAKLVPLIRGTSTAREAKVDVTIEPGVRFAVEYGGELLGELRDDASNSDLDFFNTTDERIGDHETYRQLQGPLTCSIDLLARLKDIKVTSMSMEWGVVDMAEHPGTADLLSVAVGPTFRGLIRALDRDLYAAGGPHGDGPGTPAHLLQPASV